MEVLIDQAGNSLAASSNSAESQIWQQGVVHILGDAKSSVAVSFNPSLLNQVTIAATFYRILDLQPKSIIIFDEPTYRMPRIFENEACAFFAIEWLVKRAQNASWPDGECGCGTPCGQGTNWDDERRKHQH